MAIFDSANDAPNQIKVEGEQITITFKVGKPSSTQGTASWNIPSPAQGCKTAAEGRGAYCGIVLVLDTKENRQDATPSNGTRYEGDPTASRDLHAGDVIGTALVVGAFYEGEKRSNNQELTTSLIVSDLDPSLSYFVTAYAVDCQGRYHTAGVSAYSRSLGNKKEDNTPSTQTVALKEGEGVLPTDGTNLTPGKKYKFDVNINDDLPNSPGKNVTIEVDGADVGTYQDLLNAINKQLNGLGNPAQSGQPPEAGKYVWDADKKQLLQFDGKDHNPINAIVDETDPSDLSATEWWYNPTTKALSKRNTTTNIWEVVAVHAVAKANPRIPKCDMHWYNGTDTYKWNSTTWCALTTYKQEIDPSLPVKPECGTFWFDSKNHKLAEWRTVEDKWLPRSAIYWPHEPNTLSNGTFWFNSTINTLFKRDAGVWSEQLTPLYINSETQPQSPANGTLWYKSSTEELKEFNTTGNIWNDKEVLVWKLDPTKVESCNIWWRSTDEALFVWDIIDSTWDQVHVVESKIDPSKAKPIVEGSAWINTATNEFKIFKNGSFVTKPYIAYPTDPTKMAVGSVWFDSSKNVFKQWSQPINNKWNTINTVESTVDPALIPQGTFWFDTTTNTLNQRVGLQWAAIPYLANKIHHSKGTIWFNTATNKLMEWDGKQWIETSPPVKAEFDKNGNIAFVSKKTGSSVCMMIPTPGGQKVYGTGFASDNVDLTFGHEFGHHGEFENIKPPVTKVTKEEFLFNEDNLPGTKILRVVYGSDGMEQMPSYNQIGVGDDGSPDERRELADSIRIQLGYPVVDVELTPAQLDTSITSALESLRKRSSIAYRREYFFLIGSSQTQHYVMTSKRAGFNKIVDVIEAHRFNYNMMSMNTSLHGQAMLQDMFTSGSADLVTYHLTAQYIEEMNHMFRPRTTFMWDETNRTLDFFQQFEEGEKILLECKTERTEQELLTDRRTKTWIEKFASATARIILSEIRGKYTQLPGAGGGVTLNAQELIVRADADIADCMEQLKDFTTENIDDWGMGTSFIIG